MIETITPTMLKVARTLSECEEKTSWGYQIAKLISNGTHGWVYQSLERLFDGGYVTRSPESESHWLERVRLLRESGARGDGRRRTMYTLTWRGQRLVDGARTITSEDL